MEKRKQMERNVVRKIDLERDSKKFWKDIGKMIGERRKNGLRSSKTKINLTYIRDRRLRGHLEVT